MCKGLVTDHGFGSLPAFGGAVGDQGSGQRIKSFFTASYLRMGVLRLLGNERGHVITMVFADFLGFLIKKNLQRQKQMQQFILP